LSAFAFLFSELVQYFQTKVNNVNELERKLEEAGYGVGLRVLELLCHRERVRQISFCVTGKGWVKSLYISFCVPGKGWVMLKDKRYLGLTVKSAFLLLLSL
jgi:hypothetical protein